MEKLYKEYEILEEWEFCAKFLSPVNVAVKINNINVPDEYVILPKNENVSNIKYKLYGHEDIISNDNNIYKIIIDPNNKTFYIEKDNTDDTDILPSDVKDKYDKIYDIYMKNIEDIKPETRTGSHPIMMLINSLLPSHHDKEKNEYSYRKYVLAYLTKLNNIRRTYKLKVLKPPSREELYGAL